MEAVGVRSHLLDGVELALAQGAAEAGRHGGEGLVEPCLDAGSGDHDVAEDDASPVVAIQLADQLRVEQLHLA